MKKRKEKIKFQNNNNNNNNNNKIIINENELDNVFYNGGVFYINPNNFNINDQFIINKCKFNNILSLCKDKIRYLIGINSIDTDNAIFNIEKINNDLHIIIKNCDQICLNNLNITNLECIKDGKILYIKNTIDFL